MWRISILAFLLFVACKQTPELSLTSEADYFGETIDEQDALVWGDINWAELNDDPMEVKVRGTIKAVCQAKGCWMTLNDPSGDEEIFIKFKDYGFFVPKNAAGREAVVRGTLTNTETSIEELRHYAEDEGKSAEEIAAITEPRNEYKMMADGVIIF